MTSASEHNAKKKVYKNRTKDNSIDLLCTCCGFVAVWLYDSLHCTIRLTRSPVLLGVFLHMEMMITMEHLSYTMHYACTLILRECNRKYNNGNESCIFSIFCFCTTNKLN